MNILNKLTIKHLKMNKKRTIVTIIGVILSTALMVGIGLLLSTFREMMIAESISYSGEYHLSISDLDKEKLETIKRNSNTKYMYSKKIIGYAEADKTYDYKPYYKIIEADSNYLKELDLKKGRFPENQNEIVIPSHLNDYGMDYKIGDKITLYLGNRLVEDAEVKAEYYVDGEIFKRNGETKTYEIVGIVERDVNESYSDPGFNIISFNNNLDNNIETYVRLKKPNKAYDLADNWAKMLNFENRCIETTCYDEINFNTALLSLYGASKYDNTISGMGSVLAIMLTVISIGCIIVIYNSFAISVMERKKQFGLFSSIGTTRTQLRKTVFFEAFIISVIGIPLGILSSYIGIGIVVILMNNLISDFVGVTFKLCTYPIFLVIPIIFMILTIFISAFIPARRASKITPIEAIRQNDDIKIKGKKLKTPKFIRRIFGIEGEIALKNIKRNKKKYRITIASLFISIVMFVSFSSFLDYSFRGTKEYMTVPEFDFALSYQKTEEADKLVDKILSHKLVTDYTKMYHNVYELEQPLTSMYSDKMTKHLKEVNDLDNKTLGVLIIDNESYDKYLDKIGYKENKPVLYNRYHGISYSNSSRVSKSFDRYKKGSKEDLRIGNRIWDDDKFEKNPNNYEPEFEYLYTIKDYYISNEENLVTSLYEGATDAILLMSESYYENNLNGKIDYYNVSIKTSDIKTFDQEITEMIDANENIDLNMENIAEQFKMVKNLVLMMQILVYGFISLVTLIGVTSVFNTINTSIALRRKEFAMLRSMGLTPKGFNKILYFESLFVGLKSLLYGLPFSILIIFLLHSSMSNMVEFSGILIPYKSIVIAIFGVFIIVIITMMYASNKIKKENILEAIREENI